MAPEGTANPQRWAELATPDERPRWDCNTEAGRGHLERYQAAILQGLKRGAPKRYEYGKTLQSDSKGKRITLSSVKDGARPVDFICQ